MALEALAEHDECVHERLGHTVQTNELLQAAGDHVAGFRLTLKSVPGGPNYCSLAAATSDGP